MNGQSAYQIQVLAIIKATLASRSSWAYIKPSWIMAHIQVESGFQPLVVNGDGRQDGLMQVIPSTVEQMQVQYTLGQLPPQTDPATSILCGICYWDWAARYLFAAWKEPPPLSAVVMAYNEGAAAAAEGRMVPAYWDDWIAAQQIFAADGDDSAAMVVVT